MKTQGPRLGSCNDPILGHMGKIAARERRYVMLPVDKHCWLDACVGQQESEALIWRKGFLSVQFISSSCFASVLHLYSGTRRHPNTETSNRTGERALDPCVHSLQFSAGYLGCRSCSFCDTAFVCADGTGTTAALHSLTRVKLATACQIRVLRLSRRMSHSQTMSETAMAGRTGHLFGR